MRGRPHATNQAQGVQEQGSPQHGIENGRGRDDPEGGTRACQGEERGRCRKVKNDMGLNDGPEHEGSAEPKATELAAASEQLRGARMRKLSARSHHARLVITTGEARSGFRIGLAMFTVIASAPCPSRRRPPRVIGQNRRDLSSAWHPRSQGCERRGFTRCELPRSRALRRERRPAGVLHRQPRAR